MTEHERQIMLQTGRPSAAPGGLVVTGLLHGSREATIRCGLSARVAATYTTGYWWKVFLEDAGGSRGQAMVRVINRRLTIDPANTTAPIWMPQEGFYSWASVCEGIVFPAIRTLFSDPGQRPADYYGVNDLGAPQNIPGMSR